MTDMKLEVVVIPVSDVDRAKKLCTSLGLRPERIGSADPNWPDWYAAYIVAEQAGAKLPL